MTTKQLKQIMKMLKVLYAELEERAKEDGVDITSPEFEQVQAVVREKYLTKKGFTTEEYREAKEKLEELQTIIFKGDKGETGQDAHTPTNEELTALIKPLIPSPVAGHTPTKEEILALVKPLIPQVKDGQAPSDERLIDLIKPLLPKYDAELGYLEDKINKIKIPIPEKIDTEKLKEEIITETKNNFGDNLKKNIDILGMPDFRKLAMGLQEQINLAGHTIQDEGTSLSNRKNLNFVGTGVTVTDTSETNTTTVTLAAGGHTIQNAGVDLTARTYLNFAGSLTATDDAVNNQSDITATRTGVYRTIWIPASAMTPRVTNGAAGATEEYAAQDIMMEEFLFDGTTSEGIQFTLNMPDEYNLGTVKMKLYWDAATGASAGNGVVFGIKAGALSNDDAIDAALGTEVTVSDTVIAVGDLHITAATGAITIGGTPALGDMVVFQITRNPADASDTMSQDCKFLGASIQYLEGSTESSSW